MKIFMYISLSLALIFLFFSISSAHITFSQSQEHQASSQSQEKQSSTQNHESHASSQSQEHYASSQSQVGNASSQSLEHDASSQSQGRSDASSQSQGNSDASNRSQGHDSSSQSHGRDSYRRKQGHDGSSQSQGNDGSNQSHEHNVKSERDDVSSQSQGLNASFDFHGSYKGCFSKVYAFGGSDTDTGNANVLGGLLNATFAKSKGSGRLGDGRLVVDFLCDALSVPQISAYKEVNVNSSHASVNFAVAGSTALPGDLFSLHNLSSLIWKDSPTTFQTQIEWFNKFLIDMGCKGPRGGASCKADIQNSLFWIGEMGLTDFMTAIGSSIPLPHVTDISIRIVCELLKTMLDNGAKYVVVQGLPPLGCLPTYMSSSSDKKDRDHMGCVASANIGIISYNQILQERLQKFRKLYPHCSILYADYWNAYLTILTNPKKYEIEEPFKACCEERRQGIFTISRHSLFGSQRSTTCKDPSKYISWDGIHLTEAMNKKLTALFLNQGFCKPSFTELVQAKLKM